MNPDSHHRDTESAEEQEASLEEVWDDALPAELNRISEQIIGAAIEVHRHLGPGYQEATYEKALAIELELRGVRFSRQHEVQLQYKGRPVGEGRLDLLVEEQVIVELKAVEILQPVHRAQCLSYLRATGLSLCLLINFNTKVLRDGIRRLAYFRR